MNVRQLLYPQRGAKGLAGRFASWENSFSAASNVSSAPRLSAEQYAALFE